MLAFLLVGLVNLVAAIVAFERWRVIVAAAASVGFGVAFAAAAASSGAFAAWPYALLATALVLAHQLASEALRRMRAIRARPAHRAGPG